MPDLPAGESVCVAVFQSPCHSGRWRCKLEVSALFVALGQPGCRATGDLAAQRRRWLLISCLHRAVGPSSVHCDSVGGGWHGSLHRVVSFSDSHPSFKSPICPQKPYVNQ